MVLVTKNLEVVRRSTGVNMLKSWSCAALHLTTRRGDPRVGLKWIVMVFDSEVDCKN